MHFRLRHILLAIVAVMAALVVTAAAQATPLPATISAGPRSIAPAGRTIGLALAPRPPTPPPAPVAAPALAPAVVAPPAPPPAPVPTHSTLALPTGKGMWIWLPEETEGGDPGAIVAKAQAVGLTHLYVRTGSSVDGFYAAHFLDALLPVAHAAGIKIIGWDFPYLSNAKADVERAVAAITYTTPTGDRLDGFSADIETPAEGVWLSPDTASAYGVGLRSAVGPSYPLIATVPRPTPSRQSEYPYAELAAAFDAIAPMVYWIDTPPDEDAAEAVDYLSGFGKPVLPVGQAYDSSLDGGQAGTPTADEISAFMNASAAHGAKGVSFWSWQHASDAVWGAIAAGPEVGAG